MARKQWLSDWLWTGFIGAENGSVLEESTQCADTVSIYNSFEIPLLQKQQCSPPTATHCIAQAGPFHCVLGWIATHVQFLKELFLSYTCRSKHISQITHLQLSKMANELLDFFTSSKTAALFTFSLAMSQIFKIPRAKAFMVGSSMKSGLWM